MATYRLFPSTSGPGSAVSYGGNFISGVSFTVSQGGCWFQGYWWWVASNGVTSPTKCALWCVTGTGLGTLVPNSVVTSGTLTAGQWNYIPLATPVPLAIGYSPNNTTYGGAYIAAVGVNGNFPATSSQFNTGDPYAAGITSGPLVAYSGTTGSKVPPYGGNQGTFSTGGTDPSVTMPATPDSSGDGATNFWVDVQVSDTTPPGYSGTYRLWPNKFDANSVVGLDSAFNYDICVEVRLTQSCVLSKMWTYSPGSATSLPTAASVWSAGTGLIAATNSSPSWSGAAGSGWVSCPMTGTLPAGSYRAGVYNANGTGGQWGATDNVSDYWGAGAGLNGITNGPLYAPNLASASECWEYNASDGGATPPYSNGTQTPGQSVFGQLPGGGDTLPQLYATGVGGVSQNYWVDLEVTVAPIPPPATTYAYSMRTFP